MITTEAITTVQTRKNTINHWVLQSLTIGLKELGVFGDFQNSMCLYAFFFSMKVYANKQGIQDSIANGKYPNYKDTNKQNEKETNIKGKCGHKSIFETSRGSCNSYITGQSIPIRNSAGHK